MGTHVITGQTRRAIRSVHKRRTSHVTKDNRVVILCRLVGRNPRIGPVRRSELVRSYIGRPR